uniref:site-specific DNA-methyltransferase (adenine-specific) n=1 Tax=viral metagenome TaxID=1070528 RepID=A0A6C0HP50_9ZZZZ
MPVYTCELCQKEFNQKGDLTKHKGKKTPCITMEQIQGMTKAKEETNDIKELMKGTFKQCLDILRSEGLTGDKALRNLSYILILKLIEPQFRTTIDIQNFPYEYSVEDDIVEPHKARLMKLVYFSELVQEEQTNLCHNLKFLWDDILSQHPSTKGIFLKGKTFDMKRGATFKRLIDAVNSIPETTADVLGGAYEDVIKELMTGKVLGQFFTEPRVKKIMIKLVNPQLHPDGTIDTCGDPTMGTGGFLISYMQEILAQSKAKRIEPNWDFIKAGGLYGKELEPDTYQLAVSNMLISSGHLFEQLDQGDSLHEPINRKFDVILSNPPFGIKGIKYDDFTSVLKDAYVPIKTDNAVSLFLQAIVYMLKVGGRCAVVLPDGQDLFSKARGYSIIREYLMKTCDLKEILYLPSGIFTNTTIKTCIFFFVKKCEGSEALTVVTKTSPKKVTKDYTFDKKHHTKSVKFYDYNPYEEIKNLLVEVPIETIDANSYSLNYAEYLKEEVEEYEDGIEMKTLGEVCKDISTSKNIPSSDRVDGTFRFFTCSREETTHNEYHYDGTFIIHGSRGSTIKESIFMTNNEKFAIGTSMFISEVKNKNECLSKYIYYYLRLNQSIFSKYINGTAIPMISKSNYYDIKIPIPSLERQQEIVDDLDFIAETNKASTAKIADLKRLNEFCLRQQKRFGENEVKMLGEVSKINYGKRITKTNDEGTEYLAYGGGDLMSYKVNQYNRDGVTYKISRDGLSRHNCISKIYGKIFLNDTALTLDTLDDKIVNNYYIGEYLLNQKDFIYDNCTHGTAQLHIDITKLMNLKIHIPSLERQKEIVEYCEKNDTLIQQLEQEIERNQGMAKQFMSGLSKH